MSRSRILALWLLAFVTFDAATARSNASCPESSIQFVPAPASFSTLARWDTSGAGPLGGAGEAGYDLVAGTQRAEASASPDENLAMVVVATDEYELVGPIGATPISFHARLHLTGSVRTYCRPDFGFSHVSVWSSFQEEGTGKQDAIRLDGRYVCPDGAVDPLDHTLDLALAHAVGEPFRLDLQTAAGAIFGDADIAGSLSFVLPTGYLIQSCQGYAGFGSVPVRPTTWGALKVRYR